MLVIGVPSCQQASIQTYKQVYIDGCALSEFDAYETPFYDLKIDQETYGELQRSKSSFQSMSKETDEDEHSIELHLPYIAKVMEDSPARGADRLTIVPVLVGSLSARQGEEFFHRKIVLVNAYC